MQDSNSPDKVADRSKSELNDVEGSQLTGKDGADVAFKYERTKNVFRMLIEEADYLIDNRALERCEGQSMKDQFRIKIDSVRKSLGIDNMDDVDLLVETFYNFEAKYKKQQDAILAEQLAILEAAAAESGQPIQPLVDERRSTEDPKPTDPLYLDLDPDHLVLALDQFHIDREDRAVNDQLNGNTRNKKKSNFESAEQKAEREKRKQKMFWEKLTTVLTPQKLSVWKALDAALTKYYNMLVTRQNVIEDTGMLN